MNITVNGESRQIEEGTTLSQLIEQIQRENGQDLNPNALSTAVNEQFIARHARDQLVLKDADQVFTFTPVVGG